MMCFSFDISFTGRSLCCAVYCHCTHKYFCKFPKAGGVFVFNKHDPESQLMDPRAFSGEEWSPAQPAEVLGEEHSFSLEQRPLF